MTIYLYTENFETERFDLYQFADGCLHVVDDVGDYANIMSKISSDWECVEDIDENGVSVAGGVYGIQNKPYVTFKILINEVAPSGRRRLVFGCTEPNLLFRYRKTVGEEILKALEQLTQKISITISDERLSMLEKCIVQAQKKACWMLIKRQVAIAGATILTTCGLIKLAKKCKKRKNGEIR